MTPMLAETMNGIKIEEVVMTKGRQGVRDGKARQTEMISLLKSMRERLICGRILLSCWSRLIMPF